MVSHGIFKVYTIDNLHSIFLHIIVSKVVPEEMHKDRELYMSNNFLLLFYNKISHLLSHNLSTFKINLFLIIKNICLRARMHLYTQ